MGLYRCPVIWRTPPCCESGRFGFTNRRECSVARSSRIPRTMLDLLKALDDHQYLLRQALHDLRADRAHIKTLSTELRTIICLSNGTEGLLWRLADELKVSDEIQLHVAMSVDRDHPLARGLSIWQVPFQRAGEGLPGAPIDHVRLRDVIKKC